MALAWGGNPEVVEASRTVEGPACGGGPGNPGVASEGGGPCLDTWLVSGLLVFLGYGALWIALADGRIEASSWEAANLAWLFPFDWGGPYPPLARFLASLAIPGSGLQPMTAVRVVVLAAFALGLLFLVRLGTRSHSRAVGVLACLMALSSPLLAAQSRMFVLEVFMLATLGAAAELFVMEAEPFSTAGWSLALGIVLGLNLLVKWSFPYYMGIFLLISWARVAWRSGRTPGQSLLMLGAGFALPLGVLLALPLLYHEELQAHSASARLGVLLATAGLVAAGRRLQTSRPRGHRAFRLVYLLAAVGCAVFVSSFYYLDWMGTLVHYFQTQYASSDRPNQNLAGLATWSGREWTVALTVFLCDTVNVPLSYAFYRFPFFLWVPGLAWCLVDRECRKRNALYLWMAPATLLGLGFMSSSEAHYFLVPLFFSTLPACAGLASMLRVLPAGARSAALHGLAIVLLVLAVLNLGGVQHPGSCRLIQGRAVRGFVQNLFRHDLYSNWEELQASPRAFVEEVFSRPALDRDLPFWSIAPPQEDFLEGALCSESTRRVASAPRVLILYRCDTLVDVLELYHVWAAAQGRTLAVDQWTNPEPSSLAAADHDFLVICSDSEAFAREWRDRLGRDCRYKLLVRKSAGPGQEFHVALYGRVQPQAPQGGPPEGAP